MKENSLYNWSIKSGDYEHRNGDYDKLYKKGIKRDKIMRFAIWIGAGFLTYIVFFKVLAYAAAR
jgi:hypothetical protein